VSSFAEREEKGESSQYPAVHGLEPVADVRERAAEQYGHGVRHVCLRGLLVQLHGHNPFLDRHAPSVALPAAAHAPAGCRRAPIAVTVAPARAEGARGSRGEGRGPGGRGGEETEGGSGGRGGAAAASRTVAEGPRKRRRGSGTRSAAERAIASLGEAAELLPHWRARWRWRLSPPG